MRSPEQLARLARSALISRNRLPGLLEQAQFGTYEPQNLIELGPLLSGQPRSIRYRVPARIRRRGVEQKLVVPGADSRDADCRRDPSLLRLITRSCHWFEAIAPIASARDRPDVDDFPPSVGDQRGSRDEAGIATRPVSYTHLTLPTKA